MLSLVIVLIGVVCFQRLTTREYPNIDPPVVTVETAYPGASAAIVESRVTQPLEEALAGLEGVELMTSISREQVSQITLTFLLSRDPEGAASDVRDRVARATGTLPREVIDPVVQKAEADANPIIWVALSSERHDRLQLSDYADRMLKDRLQALPGVAFIRQFGSRYTMRVWLDPERLAGFGMTPQDVEAALTRQNVEVPAGRIESSQREFTVMSETDLRTAEQFNDLILRDRGGFLVRLRDVGSAELGGGNERFATRYNGQDAIGMGIVKQSSANPLDVSAAVRAEVARIGPTLPAGMRLDMAYDSSIFIEASIRNVQTTVLEATALVVLIIFFFLRSLRATIIPLVTIPVSLIGACAVMLVFGFSINTLTLLAAVLAVGLVVDDAIVMLENIHRHVENGMPRREAALKGAREIGFAIIAMTLTLAAVYAPVGFQQDLTGKLFKEFAWTLAGAVLVSGFVALTLSPMMCSVLLRHESRHGSAYNLIERLITGMTEGYRRALAATLRSGKAIVVGIGVLVAASGIWLFMGLKSELSPLEDRGIFLGVFIAPEGSTLQFTDGYARRLEGIYKSQIPELSRYFMVVGFPTVANGISFVRVKEWEERERSIFTITKGIGGAMFAGAPGVLAFPITPASLGSGGFFGKPVSLVVLTTESFESLSAMMDRVLGRLGKMPELVQNPETDLKLNKPQLRVALNRDKAAAMGVSPLAVGQALETLLGGRQVTRFKREGEQYDVLVQLQGIDRTNPRDLNRIYVRGDSGRMVGLANVISMHETVAPRELNHFNQLRAASLTANLAPGVSLGEALTQVEGVVREELPSATIDYTGQSRDFKRSSQELAVTFALALIFIYLVLAAQFESFVSPLIIMLTVPFAMAGAFLALKLMG
ncbi:MAG: efflux RND transporter permease subunit, partial [Gammaproteobacteria bacterium]